MYLIKSMLDKICFELLNELLNCINQPTVAQKFISIDIYLQKINENGTLLLSVTNFKLSVTNIKLSVANIKKHEV